MDTRTRFDDLDEAIQTAVEAKMASAHTAVPSKIVSVNWAKQTCVVQPTIKCRVRKPDGTLDWISMPQIQDVPIHFPAGGNVTMTFPLKAGDEVLAMIGSKSQDVWQQSGDEQQQVDLRAHDLSNAFAIPGFKSEPNALSNVSSTSTQIRSNDGQHVIDLHPSNGLTLTSAQGLTLKVGEVSMAMTAGGVEFTTPSIKSNGHAIDHTHLHTGVVAGGDLTGTPV